MRPLRGIVLKIASVVIFIVMAALIKATARDVPPGEAVFFRSLFALPVIVIWLAARGELGTGLRARNPLGHVWRGVLIIWRESKLGLERARQRKAMTPQG